MVFVSLAALSALLSACSLLLVLVTTFKPEESRLGSATLLALVCRPYSLLISQRELPDWRYSGGVIASQRSPAHHLFSEATFA